MSQNYLHALDLTLGILLSFLTLVFLIRLILTWYPKVDLNKGFWLLIAIPTSSILNVTRKLIPPIGGVDVGPVWKVFFLKHAEDKTLLALYEHLELEMCKEYAIGNESEKEFETRLKNLHWFTVSPIN